MDARFLDTLRCPVDPERAATLHRDREHLECDGCGVRYPIKNGLPVLIADDADLPPGCDRRLDLPCQQRLAARRKQKK
ncbi:Trm112 family protein [Fimbriiglobus ruber]|uniref:Uncharacterized protein n=1 Tax=Fimbriiglobus ruber TaxID=1908690 RepID=A0A225DUA9_9BACT|nr:Trm112 family protein [Fimbriiglobus ruber]OWK43234.1 hypothetical protein FRUB_02833 [Fimbriiglobus ruber]